MGGGGGGGGGGGEGVRFESKPWYGKRKHGRVLSIQVDLQITSRVRLVVLYYINCTSGADLTISVSLAYRYSKGKKAQLYLKKHIA